MITEILAFITKDFTLEFRRGYAFSGLVVFVLCVAYIIFVSFANPNKETWITIYWIAFLFMSVHAVLKGFSGEQGTRFLYYHTLVKPEVILLSKWLYHTVILFFLGLLMYGALATITSNPFTHIWLFVLVILLGAIGITLCFTLISGIAVKSDQSATLMTILAFPLVIPILLHLIRLSRAALTEVISSSARESLLTLGAIDLLLIGLGLLLFPYLWRS